MERDMPTPTNYYYYTYDTAYGTVSIKPVENRYAVFFEGHNLGSYHSAEAAASDVSGGHTFSPPGGQDLSQLGIPEDLSEWNKKLFAAVHRLRPA